MAENQPTNPGQQRTPPPPPPNYYHMQKRKSNWWIPVVVILGVILLFFVMIGVFISMVGSSFESEPYEVKDNSVLYLNLAGNIPEYTKDDLGTLFSGRKSNASFFETLIAIKKAKEDGRIKGIYIKSFGSEMGFAKAAGDRLVFMDEGMIVEKADTKEFFANPKSERTKLFLSQIL